MNFKEKLRSAFFKIRTKLLVGAIVILVLIVPMAVVPISIGLHDAATQVEDTSESISDKEKKNIEEDDEDGESEGDDENALMDNPEFNEDVNTGREIMEYNWDVFYKDLGTYITSPIEGLEKCFTAEYFPSFFKGLRILFYLYVLAGLIGFIKAIPKHTYSDIEHGSSKWSEGGEQYGVLSNKKGIILAEKNYLPVDKRGNVNVLVVRRFWCW